MQDNNRTDNRHITTDANTSLNVDELENIYDPIVWHDPTRKESSVIVYPNVRNRTTTGSMLDEFTNIDMTRVAGISFPLIQINNVVIISPSKIKYFELRYVDFIPTVHLEIYTNLLHDRLNPKIQSVTLHESTMSLAIIPQSDNGYRKISLKFNVISQIPHKTYMEYECVMRWNELTDVRRQESIQYYTCDSCHIEGQEHDNDESQQAPMLNDFESSLKNIGDTYKAPDGTVYKKVANDTIIKQESDADIVETPIIKNEINEHKDNIKSTVKEICDSSLNDSDIYKMLTALNMNDDEFDDAIEYVNENTDITDNEKDEYADRICNIIDTIRGQQESLNAENRANRKRTTTWQALHTIAMNCGLGFAGSPSAKFVNDRKVRICQSSYADYIKKEMIGKTGIGIDSILDIWLDLYGYINLINVGELFTSRIDTSKLKIYASVGIDYMTEQFPQPELVKLQRVLTNYNLVPEYSNMVFDNYIEINNNSQIDNIGTNVRHFTWMPIYNGGNGSCVETDIKTHLNTVDGILMPREVDSTRIQLSQYSTHNTMSDKTLADMQDISSIDSDSDLYDPAFQKSLTNSFNAKYGQTDVIIHMKRVNLGLQRGTLVILSTWTNDFKSKSKVIEKAIENSNDVEKLTPIMDGVNEPATQVPDITKSGLYYIKGMYFRYRGQAVDDTINQYLVLTKVSANIQYYNNSDALMKIFRAIEKSK